MNSKWKGSALLSLRVQKSTESQPRVGVRRGGYSKKKTNQMYGEQHDQEIGILREIKIQVADIFLFPHSSSQHLD